MNNHSDKNTLLLFFYEELTPAESRAVKEHVSKCKTCQRELMRVQETLDFYQQASLEVPAQEILLDILAREKKSAPNKSRIRSQVESLFAIRQRWSTFQLTAGTLLLVLLVISLFIFFRQLLRQPAPPNIVKSAIVISEWQSPTEFLLKSQGEQLLKTVPQVGRSLSEIKPIIQNKNN